MNSSSSSTVETQKRQRHQQYLQHTSLHSTFLFALDSTITANIQADICLRHRLLWGKLFFQFNTKWTYIISVVIFEVGSASCGAAPNMDTLIVGRVLCGIGGSGLYIGVMTFLAETTTLPGRPMYVAATGLTWGSHKPEVLSQNSRELQPLGTFWDGV
ncbi:hypothetical protein BJY04DRAFT_215080 [Aspergillus karnatakaensis]|uniref:uncharacterized protein n=1 Tax=Aspergillus karnatakaensis TaxID=1810916 RepID=UPI003CCD0691